MHFISFCIYTITYKRKIMKFLLHNVNLTNKLLFEFA